MRYRLDSHFCLTKASKMVILWLNGDINSYFKEFLIFQAEISIFFDGKFCSDTTTLECAKFHYVAPNFWGTFKDNFGDNFRNNEWDNFKDYLCEWKTFHSCFSLIFILYAQFITYFCNFVFRESYQNTKNRLRDFHFHVFRFCLSYLVQ